jgi:hypothetical protein
MDDRDLTVVLDEIMRQLDALRRRVESIENNAAPTIPIYDSTDWPQDAIEGQVVIAPINP